MAEALRNYETFVRSLRNFDRWLGDAAPGAMDIDALIERNNKFLVLEGKPWRSDTLGVSVNYGQHLALAALSEVEDFTVYLVGEENLRRLWIAEYSRHGPTRHNWGVWWPKTKFLRMTPAGLRELVRGWWQEAAA